jgi:hypothetical protein
MAQFLSALTPTLCEFIAQQHMFFTASAPLDPAGRVNLSPKGIDTFRVLSDREVAYLDLTGSGNETASHLRENGRITIMFCSFEPDGKPLILRLYGRGESVRPQDSAETWNELMAHFVPQVGQRQIIRVRIESVQTSCGFGVPHYEFKGHRDLLHKWAEKKGDGGLREYWGKKNRISIDGLPTGMNGDILSTGQSLPASAPTANAHDE